jgi:hypothetical protein
LYPHLSDIIFHYNNIVASGKTKGFYKNISPRNFSGVPMQKLELLYEQMISDDELMAELEGIIKLCE